MLGKAGIDLQYPTSLQSFLTWFFVVGCFICRFGGLPDCYTLTPGLQQTVDSLNKSELGNTAICLMRRYHPVKQGTAIKRKCQFGIVL